MENIFNSELRTVVRNAGVVAVLVIDDAKHAVPMARALLAGGIDVLELTLRTEAALPALERITAEVPEMVVGIGTILTPKQVDQVKSAGAAFGVAPGMNRRVLQAAMDAELPFAPGICTPSDIESALEFNCKLLKFFPASTSGGLKHLKGMAAPYAHLGLEYIPLGGMKADNMIEYLSSPLVSAIGGSWIASRDDIAGENWDAITAKAKEARGLVKTVMGDRS